MSAWPCGNHVVKAQVTLKATGVLDIDVPSVKATGKVTLAGKPVPEGVGIGYIGFSDTASSAKLGGAAVSPTSQGSGYTYAVNLVPGHYVVAYSANNCQPGATVTGPCNGGTLKADANLTASGVLDLDVPVVSVKGKATLNGAAIPAQASRGSVTFSLTNGDPLTDKGTGASASIQTDGTYTTVLFPGTYDVGFASQSSESDPSQMPRNSGVLRPSQALTGSGTLDLDIPSVAVSGKVTLNGAAMPAAQNPGRIGFSAHGITTKGVQGVSVAITTGAYKTVLLPGSYDLGYSGDANACAGNGGPAPVVPCNGGLLKTVMLAKGQSGVLDVDVKSVKITGNVTLNGVALPDYARVSFAAAASAADGSTGGGFSLETKSSYSVLLVPGSYDIGYGGASCSDTMQPLPCNSGTIKESVSLAATGALDIDIPSVTVTGKVTLAGKEPPMTQSSRGAVTFADKKGGAATSPSFDVMGPMTYSLHILRGRYIVSYDANAQLCDGMVSPLPCGSQVVAGCP
jgi:hypothetical protein